MKPSNSALDRPLRKRFPALDWPYPYIPPHGRGKQHAMAMMFVGVVVSVLDRILVLFLLYKFYGVGFFCSRPNPYRG